MLTRMGLAPGPIEDIFIRKWPAVQARRSSRTGETGDKCFSLYRMSAGLIGLPWPGSGVRTGTGMGVCESVN